MSLSRYDTEAVYQMAETITDHLNNTPGVLLPYRYAVAFRDHSENPVMELHAYSTEAAYQAACERSRLSDGPAAAYLAGDVHAIGEGAHAHVPVSLIVGGGTLDVTPADERDPQNAISVDTTTITLGGPVNHSDDNTPTATHLRNLADALTDLMLECANDEDADLDFINRFGQLLEERIQVFAGKTVHTHEDNKALRMAKLKLAKKMHKQMENAELVWEDDESQAMMQELFAEIEAAGGVVKDGIVEGLADLNQAKAYISKVAQEVAQEVAPVVEEVAEAVPAV